MEWVLIMKIGMCIGQWCTVNHDTFPDFDSCWRAAESVLEQGPPEGKKLYAYCTPAKP